MGLAYAYPERKARAHPKPLPQVALRY